MAFKQKNITLQKSFGFAVRIVYLSRFIEKEYREFNISRQIIRSDTSVGANLREAYNAESDRDFVHKCSIAQKECDETAYWLELSAETKLIDEKGFISIYDDCQALLKIIKSIILTKKQNLK